MYIFLKPSSRLFLLFSVFIVQQSAKICFRSGTMWNKWIMTKTLNHLVRSLYLNLTNIMRFFPAFLNLRWSLFPVYLFRIYIHLEEIFQEQFSRAVLIERFNLCRGILTHTKPEKLDDSGSVQSRKPTENT